jgi:hypothetical protein
MKSFRIMIIVINSILFIAVILGAIGISLFKDLGEVPIVSILFSLLIYNMALNKKKDNGKDDNIIK